MILAVHRSGGIEEPHRISIDPDDRKSLYMISHVSIRNQNPEIFSPSLGTAPRGLIIRGSWSISGRDL